MKFLRVLYSQASGVNTLGSKWCKLARVLQYSETAIKMEIVGLAIGHRTALLFIIVKQNQVKEFFGC